MITVQDGVFRLTGRETGYWFRVTGYRHLEHIYYGARIPDQPVEALLFKRDCVLGTSVAYDAADDTYCLDVLPQEWSGIGKGDYRMPAAEIRMPDGTYTCDFRYTGYRITDGCLPPQALPGAYGEPSDCQTLELTLRDEESGVRLLLYYMVYEATDVITRRAVIENGSDTPIELSRVMSMSVDLPNDGFSLATFDGAWIKEAHRHDRRLQYGMYVNSSVTGNSSNRHNPGFLLYADGATETHGTVYGFNLLYSGNHFGATELSPFDLVRVQLGINPQCFHWTLQKGERFETPEAVLTCSADGFNGMSAHFHDFINRHIVRGDWKDRERPVLYNCWEPCFFDYTARKLLRLARGAKKLGAELFVLDDGWFGKRNNDHAGLGDYWVNRKKFPRGLGAFAKQLKRIGLTFGVWMEPEMVNEDSDLYRAHPEYAVITPGRTPTRSRNQLVLDLCNPAVRDYIVSSVGRVLDESGASYVKWDMNRHISDACSPCLADQGEFHHRYILGLYDVLTRIFRPRPHILFESCASGGNRFDLGMLCFSPQAWASDDTDPIERLEIQGGLSYLYPLSTMGAHVSDAPHQQTLRNSPLNTRFQVACFGCLGYELDLRFLSPAERKEIRAQTAFYKAHRRLLQYGRFQRIPTTKPNKVFWSVAAPDASEAIFGFFQTYTTAAEGFDLLRVPGLDPGALYRVQTRPQGVPVSRFGGLVKHLLPVTLNPNGLLLRFANRFYAVPDCVEAHLATGTALAQGIQLNNQFIGSYYNEYIRLLGDFGSNLYVIERASAAAQN